MSWCVADVLCCLCVFQEADVSKNTMNTEMLTSRGFPLLFIYYLHNVGVREGPLGLHSEWYLRLQTIYTFC